MKYTRQELDAAIDQTGLPGNQCRSLRGLVAIRRQPLFLGYFVKIVGILLLAVSVYCMYLLINVIALHPLLQGEDLVKLSDPFGQAGAMCFFLSLFLLNGAEQYLKHTRQSRAVCELLIRDHSANHAAEGTARKLADPRR